MVPYRGWPTLTQTIDHQGPAANDWSSRRSSCEAAPARYFLLPAILLLLSEKPGHGHRLAKDLQNLRFGPVEEPVVCRALGQLERDGLVTVWGEPAKARQARRVYGITDDGDRVLRVWMGVVKEERDCLDRVLHRYQVSATAAAAVAPLQRPRPAAHGRGRSSISSTYAPGRRRPVREGAPRPVSILTPRTLAAQPVGLTRCRFRIVPERSVVTVEARSAAGPMRFEATGPTGTISLDLRAGRLSRDPRPTADLVIKVDELRSGNDLHDQELLRRTEARRFPELTVAVRECTPIGTTARYRLAAEVTFRGITRLVRGTVGVKLQTPRQLVVTGDHALDLRDFQLPSPTVLMLRIYPDVRVTLHIVAELAD